ncbi:processing peptidase [Isosphaera pallida ATCC 43644]|uniref:Processing peptidase n=1 Tax=Isosphaera pallida (strain ATCC 43644 / DSM 9630 / IS1B) TaxID=575540 RepID=E8R6P5_ISOPI|nr:pitrilysin family protein [Isosphaera pallida]ADV63947.1 processing peptidase [Isosphaera pallida ATCC 43644]
MTLSTTALATSTPTAQIRVLDNGLALLVETMPQVRSAALTLLVPVGAAHETEGRDGSAAMLCEWIIRGAGQRDSRQLLAALEDLGVNYGKSASTFHTALTASTLAANLPPALEILADVLRRPRLDPVEVEPIRDLALQSLQSLEDDPGGLTMVELRRRHYPCPWGRQAVGTREGLAATTPDDLSALYHRGFRPNGLILAIAGAVEFDAIAPLVERLLGDWQPRPDPPVIRRDRGPLVSHLSKETQQTQIGLAWPSVTPADPGYYYARALTTILGGYASSRLFTEVREKRGLCYSVTASYETHKEQAAILVYAGTAANRAQETLDVTYQELLRLRRDGVESAELDMMRANLKTRLMFQQESTQSRATALTADYYHLGRVRTPEEMAQAMAELTPETVAAHAAALPIDSPTLVTLGPAPLTVPWSGLTSDTPHLPPSATTNPQA